MNGDHVHHGTDDQQVDEGQVRQVPEREQTLVGGVLRDAHDGIQVAIDQLARTALSLVHLVVAPLQADGQMTQPQPHLDDAVAVRDPLLQRQPRDLAQMGHPIGLGMQFALLEHRLHGLSDSIPDDLARRPALYVVNGPGFLTAYAPVHRSRAGVPSPRIFGWLGIGMRPSLTEDDVIEHCRKSLTGYKVPKRVYFRKELPKSNVGKILRRDLRDELRK